MVKRSVTERRANICCKISGGRSRREFGGCTIPIVADVEVEDVAVEEGVGLKKLNIKNTLGEEQFDSCPYGRSLV